MEIRFCGLLVDDQEKALDFYTNILGFKKHADIPMGEYRWLTIVSTEYPDGMELVLEPMGFPPSRTYQKALFNAGIPAIALTTRNMKKDSDRLEKQGVVFRGNPVSNGPVTSVVFEDTCGNLINLVEPNEEFIKRDK